MASTAVQSHVTGPMIFRYSTKYKSCPRSPSVGSGAAVTLEASMAHGCLDIYSHSYRDRCSRNLTYWNPRPGTVSQ